MKTDRDIPLREWQTYLKKYSDKYLLGRNEDGIWHIRLKQNLGFIQPHSVVNKQLVAIMHFKSKNAKTFFLKRAKDFDVKINQEGDLDLCLVFDEKNIKNLEKLLKIRKRYKISTKERKRRADCINKYREMKAS